MRSKTPQIETVGFRLDGDYMSRLEKLAQAYETSPHKFARQIIMDYLDDAERLKLRERVASVEYEMRRIRDDLATSIEAILVAFASKEELTEEEAREWVDENLRRS